MRKWLASLLAVILIVGLVGCGGSGDSDKGKEKEKEPAKTASISGKISVISREDGSGTRGAFTELVGVLEKDADGKKVDKTLPEAEITNSTAVMLTTVKGNKNAIGYVSLGSLNDSVKALEIDGAKATPENINNGSYKIVRPFNLAVKGEMNPLCQDFVNFILSDKGQAVVKEKGYIEVGDKPEYKGKPVAGKIVIAGSSSVTPVMEALKEAYVKVNPEAQIEVQQSDSTTGMNSAIEGIADIGMASRDLKDSEKEKGLTGIVIANDGIAVIVNNDNPTVGMTKEQVKKIFVGEIKNWEEIK